MKFRKREEVYEKFNEMDDISGKEISRVTTAKMGNLYWVKIRFSSEEDKVNSAFVKELESHIDMQEWFWELKLAERLVVTLYLPEHLEVKEEVC